MVISRKTSTGNVRGTSRTKKKRYRDHLKTILVAFLDKVSNWDTLLPEMGYSKPFIDLLKNDGNSGFL